MSVTRSVRFRRGVVRRRPYTVARSILVWAADSSTDIRFAVSLSRWTSFLWIDPISRDSIFYLFGCMERVGDAVPEFRV